MSVSTSYLKLGLYVNSGLNLGCVLKFGSLLCTRMWSLLLLGVDEEAHSPPLTMLVHPTLLC